MAAELIRPILTVDVVLLTLHDDRIHVVLQAREKAPHAGQLALVGGYVHPEEDVSTHAAAVRVLRDKAGLSVRVLEQLMTFSGGKRDPRGWSASIAYYALLPRADFAARGDASLKMLPVAEARGLPFDHDAIVAGALERCRRRAAYSSLPAFLLPVEFTLPELRRAYEAALGRSLNDSAFRRKVDELRMIEPVTGSVSKATARPAQLFRLAKSGVVEFDRTV
ncbi:NUDIX domain-containing protein [Bradyrhizobium sp. BR13661]|jgi:8-oxo-dGTP diphosphatase|uniref:NUDIX hydrolase n=1 Tax=Bradyrhizobium sp. BR13661 TaxID=2940622 RepID=UPI00247482D4|nr:NUDIX domain-containing protein [Bradyrhizobium sp. BR13661]MDH6258732.1 8-oxo-dGTP diphosphatase [Bradyrhizobium sp. BR13661]